MGKRPRFPAKTAGPGLVIETLLALFFYYFFFLLFPVDLLIKSILEKGQQIDLNTEVAMSSFICLYIFRYHQHMVAPPPQPTFSSLSLIKIDWEGSYESFFFFGITYQKVTALSYHSSEPLPDAWVIMRFCSKRDLLLFLRFLTHVAKLYSTLLL